MRIRYSAALAGILAAGLPALALTTAGAAAAAVGDVGAPGPDNAITDVPGIEVGHVQSDVAPYLTGTSVVYMPTMAVASIDQRGGAPATKETDLLSPLNSNPGVNAIQLGGSSMYGLSATNGIIRWLEDRGEGVPLGPAGVAPIVPAADIYDLNRGGDPKARTSAEWGYLAVEAAAAGPVRQGSVGGGTGARAGGLRSGVGTASVYLGDGVHVGAIVIVNPAGSPVDPTDCSLLGARFGIGDEFAGLNVPTTEECHPPQVEGNAQNTTIAVVATNAPLEKAAAQRMSANAHDGMARAISPIHTLSDGDTVFAVSTGEGEPLQVNDPADSQQLNALFNAGADTLARAITKAVLAAESTGSTLSYCDTYPTACADMAQLDTWRTQGEAPDITPASFAAATEALQQTPVSSPVTGGPGTTPPPATDGPDAPPATDVPEAEDDGGAVSTPDDGGDGAAADAPGGPLAFTGASNLIPVLLLAALLVGSGTAVVVLRRRFVTVRQGWRTGRAW